MSVSTSHNQLASLNHYSSLDSPYAWVPQTSVSLLYPEDKYSHTTYTPVTPSPSEISWNKIPQNSNSWNDFVSHIPSPSAGLDAALSPYSLSSNSSSLSFSSFWEDINNIKEDLQDHLQDHLQDQEIQEDEYSPGFSRIPRNIDIEAELSRQNLYKTELCRSWVESATCKYGSKCQFAHGQHEMRAVIRHPKYKTEICKTFYTNGTCPYGKRCRFVHNPAELRAAMDAMKLEQEEDEEEEMRQVQERFKLANLAPDPVFSEGFNLSDDGSTAEVKKCGSSLPFFQKLRKQKEQNPF